MEQKQSKLAPPKVSLIVSLLIFGTVAANSVFLAIFLKTQNPLQDNSLKTTVPEAKIIRVTALGRLEPEGKIVHLSAPSASQRLGQLFVKEGDTVRVRQIIGVMDGWESRQAEVNSIQAKVRVAKARLIQTKAGQKTGDVEAQQSRVLELKAQLAGDIEVQKTVIANREVDQKKAETDNQRYQELFKQGVVSKSQADEKLWQMQIASKQLQSAHLTLARINKTEREQIQNAQAKLRSTSEVRTVDVAVAQAELDESIAMLEKAKADLESLYVRSPINGEILSLNTQAGEIVSSQGIVEIGQTQQMYAIAEVYESDIQYIKVGQPATMSSEYGGFAGEIKGTVEQIGLQIDKPGIINDDPSVKADVRIVTVKIRLNPEDSKRVKSLNNLQVRASIEI